MTLEAGDLVQLVVFPVDIILGDELYFSGLVSALPLARIQDCEIAPVSQVNGLFQIAGQRIAPGLGMGCFHQVFDTAEEIRAVA